MNKQIEEILFPPYEKCIGYVKRHRRDILISFLLAFVLTAVYWGVSWLLSPWLKLLREYQEQTGMTLIDTITSESFYHSWTYQPVVMLPVVFFCVYLCRRFRPEHITRYELISIIITSISSCSISLLMLNSYICAHNPLAFFPYMLPFFFFTTLYAGPTLWNRFRRKELSCHPWFIKLSAILATAICCFFLTELPIHPTKFSVYPKYILTTISLYVIAVITFYALTCHLRTACTVPVVLAWFIGAANAELLAWRGDYIAISDLLSLRTAANVMNRYHIVMTKPLIASTIFAVLLLLAIWLIPSHRPKLRISPAVRAVIACLWIELLLGAGHLGLATGFLYGDIAGGVWNWNVAVNEYGYLPQFIAMWAQSLDTEVADYDPATVAETLNPYTDTADATKEPTIIVIQDEAFSDLTSLIELKTDKPVMPYFTSLQTNIQKGVVTTPSMHGPTAYAEYEFLTHDSIACIPANTQPFQQYLYKPTDNIASVLHAQENPYHCVFFHPYYASGYNREEVYTNFGFDDLIFYNDEEMDQRECFYGMVSDKSDFLDVIDIYEKNKAENPDQPLFLYNVTIQNHGGYINHYTEEWPDPIQLLTDMPSVETEIYLNLIHETDRQLHLLIDYFSQVNDDVIICFFGDHKPYLSQGANDYIDANSWHETENDILKAHFNVPYFIWANYDIPEQDTFRNGGQTADYNTTTLPYLSCHVLELAGIKLSAWESYLLDLHKKYPVIAFSDIIDASGKSLAEDYQKDPESMPELNDDMKRLSMVHYNLIFDDKNHLTKYFIPT